MSLTIMKPDKATVHCTDSRNGASVPFAVVEQWHKDRGFAKIGYHFLIQPDGEIQNGRPLNENGAHVLGGNYGNVGICLVGKDKFTKAQFDKLLYVLESLRQTYNIKPWEVYCHSQFESAIKQGKTCPNIKPNHLVAFICTENYDCIREYLL